MLSLDDHRWANLKGGYRVPYDPRPALKALESGDADAWEDLWENLYHQGDVGEASHAALPHLVRIYRQSAATDWNVYSLVASVVLAANNDSKNIVPDFLQGGVHQAVVELAELGCAQLAETDDPVAIRSILGVLALWKGAITYSRLLIEFTEDELAQLEKQVRG